ncbi:hypothetical protein G6F35_013597 [Rhizopus arrhizus]|nr:hypothetical protein G6F35_013597 [Rhizopus arrhizus]
MRDVGVGMQRIAVGVQTVQQRGAGRNAQFALQVRFAAGHGGQGFGAVVALAEAAVAAAERALPQGGQAGAAFVVQGALGDDDGALVRALVDHMRVAAFSDDDARCRQWRVHGQALLAVHHLHPVDAGARVLHPEARVAQHHAHRGEGLQVLFVHVAQLAGVFGVLAQADPQRIQHGVFLLVALTHLVKTPVLYGRVIQGHGGLRWDPSRSRRANAPTRRSACAWRARQFQQCVPASSLRCCARCARAAAGSSA